MSTASWQLFADAERQGDVLHAGLDRRTPPQMVRRIVAQGHELASHGYDHFRADATRPTHSARISATAKTLLEDIGGVPHPGYRAASFSIGARNLWAFMRAGGGRLSLQLQRLSDPPRSLRHARRAALPVPSDRQQRLRRDSRHHGCDVRARTCRAAAAAISGCCPTAARAGRCARVNRRDRQPACSISIPGRSTPSSRRRQAPASSPASATTPISPRWREGCAACWAISPGAAWTGLRGRPPAEPAWRERRSTAHRRARASRAATSGAGTPSFSPAPTPRSSIAPAGAASSKTSFGSQDALSHRRTRRAHHRRAAAHACRPAACSAAR